MKLLWRAMLENDVNINAMGLENVGTKMTATTTAYASQISTETQGHCIVLRRKIATTNKY
jgi:hypothetical protein